MKKKSNDRIIAEYKYRQFIIRNESYEIPYKSIPNSNTDKEIYQRIEIYTKEAKDKIRKINKKIKTMNSLGLNYKEIYNDVYIHLKYYGLASSKMSKKISIKRSSKKTFLNYINKKDFDSLDLELEICKTEYYEKSFNTYSIVDVFYQVYKNKLQISLNEDYLNEILKNENHDAYFIYLCFKFLKDKMREEELILKLIDKNDVNTIKTKKKI